jgi:hypothetical protein
LQAFGNAFPVLTATANLKTRKRYFRVERSAIAFLRFIFEAYDGVAVLETLDPALGIIVLHVAPGCDDIVEMVIGGLQSDIRLESIDPAGTPRRPG